MSADNVQILSMFAATDSIQNLWMVMAELREKLFQLNNQEIDISDTLSYILRLWLLGDYEFLTRGVGHQGPNASFPCIKCYITLSDMNSKGVAHTPYFIKDDVTKKNPSCQYIKRTIASYREHYASNVAACGDDVSEENLRQNGKHHFSVISDILFPISDIDHICPFILHILLGLTLKFFVMLLAAVKELDRQIHMTSCSPELYTKWEESQNAVSIASIHVNEAEERLAELKDILNEARKRKSKAPSNCQALKCICKNDDTLITCIECNKSHHPRCIGMTENDYMAWIQDKVPFSCIFCQKSIKTVANYTSELRERKVSTENELEQAKEILKAATSKLKEVYKEVEAHTGPIEKKLLQNLDDIGVQRQAYHSHSFVGNHCVKILKNISKIIVDDLSREDSDKFEQLFTKFRDIYSLASLNRFLTEEEIIDLCKKCYQFGEWFPQTFPDESITIKLHHLIFHVPEFAKRWKTVGLFSEQDAESIHAKCNSLHRTFCTTRNQGKQLQLVYTHHTMSSSVRKNTRKK